MSAKNKNKLLIIILISPLVLLGIVLAMLFSLYLIFVPQKIEMNDPTIAPMLKAAESFEREQYGFSPLPEKANVRLESRPRPEYDAMLHIDANTSRTIALKKIGDDYRWIGEQESFQGPNRYTTVDGTFYENITLNYDIETVSGFPLNELCILYSGEDKRLRKEQNLTLDKVRPIRKQWGY